ncbi:MAG: hypothetical protein K6A95_04930 [Bacteroidales bacterium]|nr:hypothetical protein [Bacteroidales bacterium]
MPRQQGGHHRAARPCGSTAASIGRRSPAAAVGNRVRSVPASIPGARASVTAVKLRGKPPVVVVAPATVPRRRCRTWHVPILQDSNTFP